MWHLGPQFSWCGGVLSNGLNDFGGIFQPQWFHGSVICANVQIQDDHWQIFVAPFPFPTCVYLEFFTCFSVL